MKYKRGCILPILLGALVFITSCKTVETQSMPRSFKIQIASENLSGYEVLVLQGAGRFAAVNPDNKNIYHIKIPAMQGGYKSFIGIKSNRHIPEEYKVVQIKKGGSLLMNLSTRDLEKIRKTTGPDNSVIIINP